MRAHTVKLHKTDDGSVIALAQRVDHCWISYLVIPFTMHIYIYSNICILSSSRNGRRVGAYIIHITVVLALYQNHINYIRVRSKITYSWSTSNNIVSGSIVYDQHYGHVPEKNSISVRLLRATHRFI